MADAQKSKSIPDLQIAPFKDRLLAYLIDKVVSGLPLIMLLWWLLRDFNIYGQRSTAGEQFSAISFSIVVLLLYAVLFAISIKGQTPGKILRNIKVVKRDGSPANFGNYLRRWLLQPIGILASGDGGAQGYAS